MIDFETEDNGDEGADDTNKVLFEFEVSLEETFELIDEADEVDSEGNVLDLVFFLLFSPLAT